MQKKCFINSCRNQTRIVRVEGLTTKTSTTAKGIKMLLLFLNLTPNKSILDKVVWEVLILQHSFWRKMLSCPNPSTGEQKELSLLSRTRVSADHVGLSRPLELWRASTLGRLESSFLWGEKLQFFLSTNSCNGNFLISPPTLVSSI